MIIFSLVGAEYFSIRNDIRASLVKTEKGHISNCLENFVLVLQKDPVLKGSICLNLLTERVDILTELGWQRHGISALTDTDLNYLALYMEKMIEATRKPITNLGKRFQISTGETLRPHWFSTLVHQYTATPKAVTPMSTF